MLAVLMILGMQAGDIVVTARKTRGEYEKCERGECTPKRDVLYSVAMAEEEFRQGGYVDARRTLQKAIDRNRGNAGTHPELFSSLHAALATIALHEGEQDVYRRAVAKRVETLRAALPPTDPVLLAATSATADMWVNLNNYRQAAVSYRAAEKAALANGDPRILAAIRIKRARVLAALGKKAEALELLDNAAAALPASERTLATWVRIDRLRMTGNMSDDAQVDRLIADVGTQFGGERWLLWSPPYGPVSAMMDRVVDPAGQELVPIRSSDLAPNRWVDVGFWIKPDGRTDDVAILRGTMPSAMADIVRQQVRARRYNGVSKGTVEEAGLEATGIYRIERVTKRTRRATPIDSHIRRRVPDRGFESVVLSGGEGTPSDHDPSAAGSS